MVRENITVLCYWNGKIVSSSRGICYEGATPKSIKVSSRITFSDLMDKMYSVTGFNPLNVSIKITCRYPSNYQEYIPLPVEDNETVSVVFDVVKQPGVHCLEFYLEEIPKSSHEPTNISETMPSGSFTQLLMQGTGVLGLGLDLNGEIQGHDNFLLETPAQNFETGHHFSGCVIEEIVASEGNKYVMNGTEINNDLLDDSVDNAGEGMDEEDVDITYEEAPSSEFNRIDGISDSLRRTSKGRPKSTRLRNEMDLREGRGTVRCSNCKQEGHNKKTCAESNKKARN